MATLTSRASRRLQDGAKASSKVVKKWEKPRPPRPKPLSPQQEQLVERVTEPEAGDAKKTQSRGMQATPDDDKEGHGVYSVAEVNKLTEDQLIKLLQALDRVAKTLDAHAAQHTHRAILRLLT